MQQVQRTSVWSKFGVILTIFLVAAAIVGIWMKSSIFTSNPATAGATAVAPAEASAISPMELMITRGRQLPATDYAEPF